MTEYSPNNTISVGSFYIHQHDTGPIISHIDNNTVHPMYHILFQSFQSNKIDISHFISNTKSIISLSNMISKQNIFSIQYANNLLRCMYSQTQFLLENNIAISFIDINDIIVINDNMFYFCNYHKLYKIKKNDSITITDFYDLQNDFLPPELIHNNVIPFSTYYTSSYYSLAILILYCLKKSHGRNYRHDHNDNDNDNDIDDSNQLYSSSYQSILNRYQHTKLYVTLKHCLVKEPLQRTFHLF